MRALVYQRYGPASELSLGDVPEPATLGRGEVRVQVRRASLNPKDALFRKGRFRLLSGRRFPKQCGLDVAGVVVESRSGHFHPGARVFGCLDEWTFSRGTLAERVVCDEGELAPLPEGLDDDSAVGMALVGLTALQALRDVARLASGQRVLVNGASGGVGTAAVQLARLLGAEVHTLSSEANRALCAELGAHATWAYSGDAWRQAGPFDVMFDVFGNLKFKDVAALLTPRGRFVSTVPSASRLVFDVVSRLRARQQRLVTVRPRTDDLARLAAWTVEGRLRTVIDSRFPLGEVQAAFARLESKRARGKIIVEIA